MKLAVLNPGGTDPEQSFPRGPGEPGDAGHAPINFHAFAACTQGTFYRKTERALATGDPVLVLIRRRIGATLDAVRALHGRGRTVLVSWKEAGLPKTNVQLAKPSQWKAFRELASLAHGSLATTPQAVPIYRAAAPDTPVAFVPTPYPLEHANWDFSIPLAERQGVFVGTRKFRPSRCHTLALAHAAHLARETGCRITVINSEGRKGLARIRAVGIPEENLSVSSTLAYPDYLRLMAQHRIVFQRDHSAVPGQVAGDALLTRTPCLGGHGAVDRLAFPACSGGVVGDDELSQLAVRLLTDDAAWLQCQEKAAELGRNHLSYGAVARRLEHWIAELEGSGTSPAPGTGDGRPARDGEADDAPQHLSERV